MSVETPAAVRIEAGVARDTPAVRAFAMRRIDVLLIVALFTLAIIPRAAWVAYRDRAPQEISDPALYSIYSDQIADGNGYARLTGEKTAYYPVGYPATVAGLKKAGDIFGWGRSIFSVKMMNGMFGAVTVLLLYLLASRMFDRRVAVVAGMLEATFPSQVYYTGAILSEPEFTMLFVAALLVLLWKPWTRGGMACPQLLSAGLLLGAGTMVRGILVIFPLVLLAVWLYYLHSKKRALLQALTVFVGISVFVVPWSMRNTIVFGELTGPSTNLGDDLCIGNFNRSRGKFTLEGKCFDGYEGLSPQETELERNKQGLRIALQDVITHPARMPELIGQKAYWLFYQDDDGLSASMDFGNNVFMSGYRREVLSFAANAIYYATAAVTILGALAFVCSRDLRRLFVLLSMLYVLAMPLVFFGNQRFHFPAIPLAVLITAATIVAIWDGRRRRLPAMERLDVR